jgi:hypothetical protein
MRGELETVNKTIKDFLHNDGYNNIRALDPWVCVKQLDVSQIWGADPVHIRKEHVANLIDGVKITLSKLAPKRRRDSADSTPGPPSKRGKTAAGPVIGGRAAPGGSGPRGGANGGSINSGGNGVAGAAQGGGSTGGGGAAGGRGGGGGNRGRGPPGGQAGGGSASSSNGYARGGNSGRGGRYGGGGGNRAWRGGRYGRMA